MKKGFSFQYFMEANPNILGNNELREPQTESYQEAFNHFNLSSDSSQHAIIQIPTGVGKTGVMALLPFGIANGRVLIITPNVTIRETITKEIDPLNHENFYLQRKVFQSPNQLPSLVQYKAKMRTSVLESANFVVLNIHKLQARCIDALIHRLPENFFDMIIIDEAHHSPARTWREAIQHFCSAKVIKLTATPVRTDGECLVGKKIYEYRLSRAMRKGYVKSLRKWEHVPGNLRLTIDDVTDKDYSVEEILAMGLKDEQWIRRSVAFSPNCCESVVKRSIELLEEKKELSTLPHKIIAVASSIKHAEMIETLYKKQDIRTLILHSDLDEEIKNKAFIDIENNRVDVVVQVSMLNDHFFLSIAAIFRPFKSYLPYTQFIGRILRIIPESYSPSTEDNIGLVVSHKHLALDELWQYYKKEIDESNIIPHSFKFPEEDPLEPKPGQKHDLSFGNALESGSEAFISDDYLNTELINRAEQEKKERKEKEDKLMELLGIDRSKAKEFLYQSQKSEGVDYKRPDLIYTSNRKMLDSRIREEIVPELLVAHNIEPDGIELISTKLFSVYPYSWIAKKEYNNAAALAVYLNIYLGQKVGKKRDDWELEDYASAFTILPGICEYLNSFLYDLF